MDDNLIRIIQLSQKGYVCSQIIMQMALDKRGEENPALIRSMAGLAHGCGLGKGTCGTLTAGACVLALCGANGPDGSTESERYMPMLGQLSDWFFQHVGHRHGGITCNSIVGEDGPAAARKVGGQIVSDTFTRRVQIFTENGFDLSG